jgi:hypothetical protein
MSIEEVSADFRRVQGEDLRTLTCPGVRPKIAPVSPIELLMNLSHSGSNYLEA